MKKIVDATEGGLDYEEIAGHLKAIFIEDRENYNKFFPLSHTRVKKPAHKMRKMLEEMGADFISFPTLQQVEYKFELVLDYGEDFTSHYFTIDYWNKRVVF